MTISFLLYRLGGFENPAGGGVEPEFIEGYGATGCTASFSERLFCVYLPPQMCLEQLLIGHY